MHERHVWSIFVSVSVRLVAKRKAGVLRANYAIAMLQSHTEVFYINNAATSQHAKVFALAKKP